LVLDLSHEGNTTFRPRGLDMENYPHLPQAQVRTTQACDYMTLLGGVSA
jgi:hypothetical protein